MAGQLENLLRHLQADSGHMSPARSSACVGLWQPCDVHIQLPQIILAVLMLKLVCCLQKFLQPDHTVMVDTGDALFFVAKMLLPKHTR